MLLKFPCLWTTKSCPSCLGCCWWLFVGAYQEEVGTYKLSKGCIKIMLNLLPWMNRSFIIKKIHKLLFLSLNTDCLYSFNSIFYSFPSSVRSHLMRSLEHSTRWFFTIPGWLLNVRTRPMLDFGCFLFGLSTKSKFKSKIRTTHALSLTFHSNVYLKTYK